MLPTQTGSLPTSNSADFKTSTNLRGEFSLGPAEDDVQELLLSRHGRNVLPCRLHFDDLCLSPEVALHD